VEWFLFVDANRDRKNDKPIHDYDIVIGPIANITPEEQERRRIPVYQQVI
jgi:hypothetical protein